MKLDGNKASFRYHSADNGKWVERFQGKKPVNPVGWQEAHNEYLQLWFEYGLIGLIILFFFFRDLIFRFRQAPKTSEILTLFGCLITYALLSIVQFPFHLARISGIFTVILGAYYAKTDKEIA